MKLAEPGKITREQFNGGGAVMTAKLGDDQDVLNLDEAAALYRIDVNTMRQLVKSDKVRCLHSGRIYRFSRKALLEDLAGGAAPTMAVDPETVREIVRETLAETFGRLAEAARGRK